MADPDIQHAPPEFVRNHADELAVSRGARWLPANGHHFISFAEKNCRLYEGARWAGRPIVLMDWQKDFAMRLYSWVMWSEFLGRWIRRFKRARLWVPKKNGKSPFLAVNGIYLTLADGELGGKTYSAAHDIRQARIVHDHALNMVRMSPDLATECTVNMSERRITHTRTTSWYGVISSDHDGQEGLNGNAIIDEGHVVDSRLASVLEYMGASREEPLEIMASTAGDKLTGWGKQQWDYGEMVNCGDVDDIGYLHVKYAAPADATDDDLATNRELWQAANPSLGTIIDPEQFERELIAAKNTPARWASFKKYRFNIWQSSSSPWLPADAWRACAEHEITVGSLAGSQGYLGLDMSLARDMTAMNLVIPRQRTDYQGECEAPEAKRYYQLPKMWITRTAVDRWSHLVPYEDWIASGALQVHESRQLDFSRIREDILEACAPYRVLTLSYDAMYAVDTAPMLADELGCELIEFKQRLLEFAEPTQMYERLVKLGLMRHFNHPVLNWMAGHVEVTNPDRSGNYRPVKPASSDRQGSRESHCAIDAIVAGVMALREACHYREHRVTGRVFSA